MSRVGQAEHYDHILDDYERHYYDAASLAYRDRYIYRTIFDGVDLNGKNVIELACGSGFNTQAMLRRFPDAKVTGLDISPRSCAAYETNTGCPALVFDLTQLEQPVWPEPADCAFVIGGLHHCIRDLPAAFANLERLIKPGGVLMMVEPNAEFMLNSLRMRWYKKDRWFQEQDEAPLRHSELMRRAGPGFSAMNVRYLGGPAYFIVLNSLILRLPLWLKRPLAPVLFLADNLYNMLPGKAPFPMFIAQWRRVAGQLPCGGSAP